MTEAEVIEAVGVFGANALTSFTVYISFTFGFLVTSFFVGSRLTRTQSFIACGLYCVSAGSAGMSQIIYLQMLFATAAQTPTVLDGLILFNETFWVWAMSIIQVMGMLVSLFFMRQIRQADTA
jgi:hypothetical protein